VKKHLTEESVRADLYRRATLQAVRDAETFFKANPKEEWFEAPGPSPFGDTGFIGQHNIEPMKKIANRFGISGVDNTLRGVYDSSVDFYDFLSYYWDKYGINVVRDKESLDDDDDVPVGNSPIKPTTTISSYYMQTKDQTGLTRAIKKLAGLPDEAKVYFDGPDLVYNDRTILSNLLNGGSSMVKDAALAVHRAARDESEKSSNDLLGRMKGKLSESSVEVDKDIKRMLSSFKRYDELTKLRK